jgi:phosphoglycerate dehydrogenase-like enzyme
MKVLNAVDATRRVLLAFVSPLVSKSLQPPPTPSSLPWHSLLSARHVALGQSHSSLLARRSMMSSSSSSAKNLQRAAPAGEATSTNEASSSNASMGQFKRTANIVALSDPNDEANAALLTAKLPPGCTLLGVGATLQDIRDSYFKDKSFDPDSVNAVFVSHPNARDPLAQLLQECPRVEWVHTRSAGIDFVTSQALSEFTGVVTNAKGQFSSTLAEYTMLAIGYFAKDLPRLSRNKARKVWDKYDVHEIKRSTLGIVGYGDIGQAAAKLAKAYGMMVKAVVRRRVVNDDPHVDAVYGNTPSELVRLFSESDYVLCAAPLTAETKGLINKACFDGAKRGAVFINVGRGPIVDEAELIKALQDGRLRGAALDVFETEPLPPASPLWEMDNVLLSPHNMDKTATFMHESTEFYVNEQLSRFVQGEPLLNVVDPKAGY